MFVRATVDLGTEPNGFLVPQRAVTFDATGQATAFFVEGGKAVTHTIATSQSIGNSWLVTAGINDGAQVVVDGLQKLSNGSPVSPLEVTLDQNGVAQAATAAGTTAAAGVTPPAANGSAAAPPGNSPATATAPTGNSTPAAAGASQ
jgi:membrane fusion protein (multidrug efflux system)